MPDRRIVSILTACLWLGPGAWALGQGGPPPLQPAPRQPEKQPDPDTPNTPAPPGPGNPAPAPMAPPDPAAEPAFELEKPGPFFQRQAARTWSFNATIVVNAWHERFVPRDRMPVIETFRFDTLAAVVPVFTESSHARTVKDSWKGELRVGDAVADDTLTVLPQLYASGERLGRLEAGKNETRSVKIEVSYDVATSRLTFDEKSAMAAPWPAGPWPREVRSVFEPQLFIDSGVDQATGEVRPYDFKPIEEAVQRWLAEERITDPRKTPILRVAKVLAGKVVGSTQVSGEGLTFSSTGLLEGIDLQGPPVTLSRGRGSEHDLTSLLLAVYRTAGIPARLVVGVEQGGRGDRAPGTRERDKLRSWVEVALYVEPKNASGKATLDWVPVDPAGIRRSSSRPPPVDRPWRGFGTLVNQENIVPFTFHFHPPTTVEAYGSPGFWGWKLTPQSPGTARQAISFRVQAASTRPEPKDSNRPRDRR